MESPSSTRRVTRSQALATLNNSKNIPMSRKIEESEKGVTKSRQPTGKQQDRSALIDITNDSPIVGLAMGSLETPSSKTFSKNRINSQAKHATTPGSGEALLRGQVKTLLQKVEEEAVLSKNSVEYRPFLHHQVNFSPMALLAPTPANTPQVSDLSGNGSSNNNGLASVTASPVEDQFKFSQMLDEIMIVGTKQEESGESEKNLMITRSLLLDFSEKSEGCDSSESSSVVTYQGCENKSSSTDDDDASIWSVQVNASPGDEEEEEDADAGFEDEDDYEEDEGEDGDDYGGVFVDELCEGMSKISVNGGGTMAKFTGKHTRFVYNSDDELEEEEEEEEEECGGGESVERESAAWSSGILRLKGLPTPKGKHLRFPEESL